MTARILSDRSPKEIAEWCAKDIRPERDAERKLAKAYLNLVNAKPVAEIAAINITTGTIINVPDRAHLKSGDKLYLRKE